MVKNPLPKKISSPFISTWQKKLTGTRLEEWIFDEYPRLPSLHGFEANEIKTAERLRHTIIWSMLRSLRPYWGGSSALSAQRWRTNQLWKTLVSETRASYFLELASSRYGEWIRTGERVALPVTTREVYERNARLPKLRGRDVKQANLIRATFLKVAEHFFCALVRNNARVEKRRQLLAFRNGFLRHCTDAAWFVGNKPRDFSLYSKTIAGLMQEYAENGWYSEQVPLLTDKNVQEASRCCH